MSKKGSEARKSLEEEDSLFDGEFTNTIWRRLNREDEEIEFSKSLKDSSPLQGKEFGMEDSEDGAEDSFSENTRKLSSAEEKNLVDEVTQWVNSKAVSSQDFSSQEANPLPARESMGEVEGGESEGIPEAYGEEPGEENKTRMVSPFMEDVEDVEQDMEGREQKTGFESPEGESPEEELDGMSGEMSAEMSAEMSNGISDESKGESKTIPLRPKMQFHEQVIVDESDRKIKAKKMEWREGALEDLESPSTKVLKGDFVDRASAYSPLAQAESLKVAQSHLLDLEKEIHFLKEENEELALAGETLRSRNDELLSQLESLQLEQNRIKNGHSEEMEVLKKHLKQKDKNIKKHQKKIKTLENHLQADLRRVHVRERELENRIEIIKNEHKALLKSKDDNFMELRRKEDRQKMEIENYRKKCQESNQQIILQKEQLARVVRTTRIILTQLEASGMDPDDPDSEDSE